MKKDNPFCPFCTDSITCFRHKEKGVKEPKAKKPIPKVSAKKKADISDKERKKRLAEFYNECLNRMPHNCMESGDALFHSLWINPRTVCCHILNKSKFPSVECNFDNIIYLSAFMHSKFDLQTERAMKEFKIAPLIKERIQILIPLLTIDEVSKIPSYYLTI